MNVGLQSAAAAAALEGNNQPAQCGLAGLPAFYKKLHQKFIKPEPKGE